MVFDGLRDEFERKLQRLQDNASIQDHIILNSHRVAVNFGNMGLDDRDVSQIATAVATHTSLQALGLAANLITDAGVLSLCRALQQNKSICFLSLESNRLTAESMKDLAAAVAGHPKLAEIELGSNRIGDNGIKTFCKIVFDDPSCRVYTLRLNDSDMSDDGLEAVSSWITSRPSFKLLNVEQNKKFTEAAAQYIAEMRCCHEGMTVYNDMDEDVVAALMEQLREGLPPK